MTCGGAARASRHVGEKCVALPGRRLSGYPQIVDTQQGWATSPPDKDDSLEVIRTRPHELAHEFARFVVDPDAIVSIDRLTDLQGIMRSLSCFRGGIIGDADHDFVGVDVVRGSIEGGLGLLPTYLLQNTGVEEHTGASFGGP